jgi:hypothetical protein
MVCQADDMPGFSTVMEWLNKSPQFADQYARAKRQGVEAMAEDILDIADDSRNDWMDKNGFMVVDNEAVQRSKLRVDTRKWIMSKLLPKKYGETLDMTSGGEPISVKVLNYYAAKNKDEGDNTAIPISAP